MADIKSIGRYAIQGIIGEGGMAQVYRAIDPRDGGAVAIKLMSSELALEEQSHIRFRREADVLRQLEHPGIVGVRDYGEHNGRPYLVMPCLGGGTLADRLEQGRLTPADIAALLPPLADALDYAHRRGVIHRDVKPSNVLFDDAGRPLLADFGIAKLLGQVNPTIARTRTGSWVGTYVYMSPEQAQGLKSLDSRSDVYSLGIVLFEMLTGLVPFTADNPAAIAYQHVHVAPPRLRQIDPTLAAGWQPVLDQVLAKKRDDRYATAGALAAAVAAVVNPQPSSRPAAWMPALALLAVLVIGGVWLLSSRNTPAAGEGLPTPAVVAELPGATATPRPTSTLAAPAAAPPGNGTLTAIVAPATATTALATATAGPPRARLNATTTLRAGPGTHYDAVAELAAGDEATVIGRDEVWAWYALRLDDGRAGWAPRLNAELLDGEQEQIALAATIPAPPQTATRPPTLAAPTSALATAVALPTTAFATAIVPPTARPTNPPTSPPPPTDQPEPTDPPEPTDEPATDTPPTVAVPPTVAIPPTVAVP